MTQASLIRYLLVAAVLAFCMGSPAQAEAARDPASITHVSLRYPVSSPYYPVVLTGARLPALLREPIRRISLYAFRNAAWRPIPFQIDRRDSKGRYQLPITKADRKREGEWPFDGNDECVFMAADLGEKGDPWPEGSGLSPGMEIEITDPKTGHRGWVYAVISDGAPPEIAEQDYISYNRERDTIESDTYRIGFSKDKPFLVDTLNWKRPDSGAYTPDLVDTMKVRHRGKLWHKFRFVRTQNDNRSRVLSVKDGPVRVIRRTVNRVRILWRLRTPSIYIDYICYRNAFFMDIFIHIPFKIGWFFSDVETLMTIDGNNDPSLPAFRVFSESFPEGLLIDGKMSGRKKALNASHDRDFLIASPYGKIMAALDVAKDFPIQYKIYLMDDQNRGDPPEDIPGQFGNGGFLTTDWEALGNAVYHMTLRVYMVRDISVDQGLGLLRHSPVLVH